MKNLSYGGDNEKTLTRNGSLPRQTSCRCLVIKTPSLGRIPQGSAYVVVPYFRRGSSGIETTERPPTMSGSSATEQVAVNGGRGLGRLL